MTILETLRKLLAIKRPVSMPEIASYSRRHRADVLAVLHQNRDLLVFDDRGRVLSTRVRSALKQSFYEEGKFWRIEKGNYGSTREMHFNNEELHDELKEAVVYGGIGDSYTKEVVIEGPENIAALRAAGLVPENEVKLDDRLWLEGPTA